MTRTRVTKACDTFRGCVLFFFGKRILGPTHPNIGRIRNYYLRNVMIKLERKLSVDQVKQKLQKALDFFQKEPGNRTVILQVDVDPQ